MKHDDRIAHLGDELLEKYNKAIEAFSVLQKAQKEYAGVMKGLGAEKCSDWETFDWYEIEGIPFKFEAE